MKTTIFKVDPAGRSDWARSGFTLTELMIVVAVIALVASIAVPSFVRAREASWISVCQSTLKSMQAAKNIAALDLKWPDDAGPSTLGNPYYKDTVSQYLQKGVRPVCPTGVDCYYNAVNEDATCTSGLAEHVLP